VYVPAWPEDRLINKKHGRGTRQKRGGKPVFSDHCIEMIATPIEESQGVRVRQEVGLSKLLFDDHVAMLEDGVALDDEEPRYDPWFDL
jgi:hypothetical protein